MTLTPDTKVGHYKILSRLGAGGMGEVYLAEDTRLGRKAAVKLLSAKLIQDEERLRRFEQEARTASSLNHPNIITIYEIGRVGSAHFIATEFIEGKTLRSHIAEKKMELTEILDVAIQVTSALTAAHAAGIVHRDIKPENIMLRPDGYVKVVDFGIAKLSEKFTDHEANDCGDSQSADATTVALVDTEPGTILGSPSYMSPEQARGLDVDARTDIFSLGVMMYEMIAGRRPFVGATLSDLIAALLAREPPPLSNHSPNVPARLEQIISLTMIKDRGRRCQSAGELLAALRKQKQRLEFEAGLEPSVPPDLSEGATIDLGSGKAMRDARDTDTAQINETDAARTIALSERAGTLVSRPFRSALTVLLFLALAAAAAFAYFAWKGQPTAIESVAVLPFINESGDPNLEYLSDGITESLINNLSQTPGLKVMSRNSVFRYKGQEADVKAIARALNVRAVLVGRIIQRADDLIIKIELIDGRDNSHVLGTQYDRKLPDILSTQEEIAKQIARKLRLELTRDAETRLSKHHTESAEAYQLYLRGRYQWNKRTEEGLKKGIEYFKQAIEEDPGYSLAYTGLADCYALLGEYGVLPVEEYLPAARAAARKALEIDDSLAEAHTSLAAVSEYEWKWQEAEEEYRRAIELNPNYGTAHHWYGVYLGNMARTDEALAEVNRALELDPLSLIINTAKGRVLYNARRHDEAIDQLRKTINMEPNFPEAHFQLALAYEGKGMYEEAIREFQESMQLYQDDTMKAWVGRVYAVMGKRGEALKVLGELAEMAKQRALPPYPIAAIYAGLGDEGRALGELERVYKERSYYVIYLKVDPIFDGLRSDARFNDLMRRVGFAH